VIRIASRAAYRSLARSEKREQEQRESREQEYMNEIAAAVDDQDTD
jgi:hypothetical protein